MEKDLFKTDKEITAEPKVSAVKKDSSKMIHVETTQELPSYKGKRLPKGKKLVIPESSFNPEVMKKV